MRDRLHPMTSPMVNSVPSQPQPNLSAVSGSRAEDHSAYSIAIKATPRTHTVTAGETALRIARRYGVSLDALLAANPGLEPRRMHVGQVLNIPSS